MQALRAGDTRRAADEAGAVGSPCEPASMFHAIARNLAEQGLPQVQLHGFHDDNLADADVVISPGAGDAADQGTVFVHVEISRSVRDDRDAASALVRAIARADLGER